MKIGKKYRKWSWSFKVFSRKNVKGFCSILYWQKLEPPLSIIPTLNIEISFQIMSYRWELMIYKVLR